jgi:hypothetical protein
MSTYFNNTDGSAPWTVRDLVALGKIRGAYADVKFFSGLSTTTGGLWRLMLSMTGYPVTTRLL